MSKRTTAAVWVRSIAELLAAEGLDVASLFAAAGIDPQELEGPSARLANEKISHLWELAVEGSSRSSVRKIPLCRSRNIRWRGRRRSMWSVTP
ncbi:AraC family transcriptional regulator ligand-binding domain-containing protein [Bradyrhizobium sp. UFLA05-109]